MRRHAEATSRNRARILDVLRDVVGEGAHVLEVAAGTGEHAAWLSAHLPVASWRPTDPDPAARASIEAWREEGSIGLQPPLPLDVHAHDWPSPPDGATGFDVVVCINMIHIAPWSACLALLDGAARVLVPRGVLYLYGPYRRGGVHTAASNDAFDRSLRARDPRWGVRDLEAVVGEAEARGFACDRVVPMPANNLSVVLRRG